LAKGPSKKNQREKTCGAFKTSKGDFFSAGEKGGAFEGESRDRKGCGGGGVLEKKGVVAGGGELRSYKVK